MSVLFFAFLFVCFSLSGFFVYFFLGVSVFVDLRLCILWFLLFVIFFFLLVGQGKMKFCVFSFSSQQITRKRKHISLILYRTFFLFLFFLLPFLTLQCSLLPEIVTAIQFGHNTFIYCRLFSSLILGEISYFLYVF